LKQIIAISIQETNRIYHLSNSQGATVEVHSPKDLLDFLLLFYGENYFKCVWNLYALMKVLDDVLPNDVMQTLYDKDRVEFEIDGEKYKIFSSQGRILSIGYSKHIKDNFYNRDEVSIFHLSQYFPGEKAETLEEIKSKGGALLQMLDELGYNPTKLSSAISIYDENVLNTKYLPTIHDLDQDGQDFCDFARPLLHRELRACYKIGHWRPNSDRQAWRYDIRAAYPSIVKDLLDTNEATYWQSNKYEPKADWGICKGKITITTDGYSPILNQEGIPIKGTWEDLITVEDWGYLNKYKIGHFELEKAHWAKFHSTIKPFQKIMSELYQMRQKGGLIETFAKAISVGLIGRFGQEYEDRVGTLNNPIYSILATSRIPLKVGKFIMENQLANDLIAVVVDGFEASKYVPTIDNKQMGDWKVSDSVNLLAMSLGYLFVADKTPQNISYSQITNEIKAHPNKSCYSGILINANMLKNNRLFNKFPKTGQNLLDNIYESKAMNIIEKI
jgi:hypothetical protein